MSLEVEAIDDALLDATSAGNGGVLRQTHQRDPEIVRIILACEGDRRTARQEERNEQDWLSLHVSFDEHPPLEVPSRRRKVEAGTLAKGRRGRGRQNPLRKGGGGGLVACLALALWAFGLKLGATGRHRAS
jgi:hypothetical protein